MKRLITLFVVIANFSFSGVSFADDFDLGIEAYFAKNYDVAHEELRPLAEQGDPMSQFLIGSMYSEGMGVPRDRKTGAMWLIRAANQGNEYAQSSIGAAYRYGVGVPKDYTKAFHYLTLAADQGSETGAFGLADLYRFGLGVEQDPQKAISLYKLAAEKGVEMAYNDLGEIYETGAIVAKDLESAKNWYRLAAVAGDDEGQENYIRLKKITKGDGVAASSDLEGRFLKAMAYIKAGELDIGVTYLEPLAVEGHAEAQFTLGMMHTLGKGVPVHRSKGLRLFRLAAEQGHAKAQHMAGLYSSVEGTSLYNPEEAIKWLRLAADQGIEDARDRLAELEVKRIKEPFSTEDEDIFIAGVDAYEEGDYTTALEKISPLADRGMAGAQFYLGQMHDKGLGLARNEVTAVKWFKLASDQGYVRAHVTLGLRYQFGVGTKKNYHEAARLFQLAADRKDPGGQFGLGAMYRDGTGVEQNTLTAIRWFSKAAEQGYSLASRELGFIYEHGSGVPKDFDAAAKWYQKSIDEGFEEAQDDLTRVQSLIIAEKKSAIPSLQTSDQASRKDKGAGNQSLFAGDLKAGIEAYKGGDYFTALELLYPLAEEGVVEAQYVMGEMFRRGQGVSQSKAEAAKWMQRAADQGHERAKAHVTAGLKQTPKPQADVANIPKPLPKPANIPARPLAEKTPATKPLAGAATQSGNRNAGEYDQDAIAEIAKAFSTEDYETAFHLLGPVAKAGHLEGQYILAGLYISGLGTRKDIPKAIALYKQSAKGGFAKAQMRLSHMYYIGKIVPEDRDAAYQWGMKAARQGNAEGQYMVGAILVENEDDPDNQKNAAKWFKLAAEQGDGPAQLYLGLLLANANDTFQEGLMWISLASAQGDKEAIETWNTFSSRMTERVLIKVEAMARRCQSLNYQGC